MVKKLAVFDLDGTLNRTDLYSVPAHLKALGERGINNVTPETIISTTVNVQMIMYENWSVM